MEYWSGLVSAFLGAPSTEFILSPSTPLRINSAEGLRAFAPLRENSFFVPTLLVECFFFVVAAVPR